jgi:hypothetical protein
MTLPHTTMVWLIRQGVCLAWLIAHAAERLGDAGVRLEVRLDDIAVAQGVDMLEVLAPLNVLLSEA